MSLNAAALELLVAKGLSGEDIVEIARALEATEKPRSKGAERQARYRANKARNVTGDVTCDVTNDVTRDVTQPPLKNNIQTPRPVSNETEPVVAAQSNSKRGTRLADDFEPPEDWIAWAMKKRGWSRPETIDECECFIRYWQAKPGREACKLDWPKTWQNWVVNSRRPNQTAPPETAWSGMA